MLHSSCDLSAPTSIEPGLLAVRVLCPYHWTTREFPNPLPFEGSEESWWVSSKTQKKSEIKSNKMAILLCSYVVKKFFFLIFIYLAAPVFPVTCGIFSWGIWTLTCITWDLVPWPAVELGPLHWKLGDLAIGLTGKSLNKYFWALIMC